MQPDRSSVEESLYGGEKGERGRRGSRDSKQKGNNHPKKANDLRKRSRVALLSPAPLLASFSACRPGAN